MSQTFQSFDDFNDYLRNKSAENEEFRARLLADPGTVIAEEGGITIPDGFKVHVHEDTATAAHFVIPPSAKLADEQLDAVAGGAGGGGICTWDTYDV